VLEYGNYRESCGKLLGGSMSLIKRELEEVAESLLTYLFPEGGYDDRWREYAYVLAERMIENGVPFGVDEVLKCQQ
jgi:hypothetical protein